MFELLLPGGELLVVFLASNPLFSVYEKLSEDSTWSKYMTVSEKLIIYYKTKNHTFLQNKYSDAFNWKILKDCSLNATAKLEINLYTLPFYRMLPNLFPHTNTARVQRKSFANILKILDLRSKIADAKHNISHTLQSIRWNVSNGD
jgi:hypothetical protein